MLIPNLGAPDGGTASTADHARQVGKPYLVVALEAGSEPATFRAWLDENRIAVLNVAGPRESQRPGVYEAAYCCLEALLRAGFPRGAARSILPVRFPAGVLPHNFTVGE
jgi:hypothetical protein